MIRSDEAPPMEASLLTMEDELTLSAYGLMGLIEFETELELEPAELVV